MNSTFSLTYKAFPELSTLPDAVARSRFENLARDFYYSVDGIKASAIVIVSGLIGLAAGLPFSVIASSVGAGVGIFAGSCVFNLMMKKTITGKTGGVASDLTVGAAQEAPQSKQRYSFPVLTDEELAIRRERQAAYLAKRRGKARSEPRTSTRDEDHGGSRTDMRRPTVLPSR